MTDYKKVSAYLACKLNDWFANDAGYDNPANAKAVVGVSGGKDSSVVAALCAKALGPHRVIGVMMPNGEQKDIQDARDLCEYLRIRRVNVNIEWALRDIALRLSGDGVYESGQTRTNMPARLRMAALYAVTQSNDVDGKPINGRVIGTSNFAERMLGWGTVFGDTVCDFNPIGDLYVDEVVAVGEALGLPERFTRKPPSDGMCGKTDEEALGFTYDQFKEWWPNRGRCDKGVEPWRSISRRVDSAAFKRELLKGIPVVKLPRNDAGDVEL